MSRVRSFFTSSSIVCTGWIALCFFLTSAVHISWVYRLTDFLDGGKVDLLSMVAAYLLQAAGMGLAALALRTRQAAAWPRLVRLALALYFLLALPALLSGSLAAVVSFGLLMSLVCGVITGFYLLPPAEKLPVERRGLVFGCGYGLAILAVWLLSLFGHGGFLRAPAILLVYLALTLAAVWLAAKPFAAASSAGEELTALPPPARKTLLLAGGTLALISLVKNLGFGFPSADLAEGLPFELSRVFYALGLCAAGLINDRSRKYGLICTVAALAIPFVMLAVSGEGFSGFFCWSLNYVFFGFFSVFRVLVFQDLAGQTRLWQLAPLGLLLGRVGDAAGEALCLALADRRLVLVSLTTVLFIAAVFLCYRLFLALFEKEHVRGRSEREVFESFAAQHDLSVREQEVLRLVLAKRSNAEIAETLFVSESTVKYHVHNLLQKVGAKSRLDLMKRYNEALYPDTIS